MKAIAVVIERPEHLVLRDVALDPPGPADAVVRIRYSGISTGTERLLWTGRMPTFPGMGYPLVPGYESVGEVVAAGEDSEVAVGAQVFVPGAACYGDIRGLFGGAASQVVLPASRLIAIDPSLGEQGTLLALAATALHSVNEPSATPGPQLVVGHGVLGRLLARVLMADQSVTPVVWETDPARRSGATGYSVVSPEDDDCRGYARIIDVSGDSGLLDTLIGRLARGGEVVLAGFYSESLSFSFPPAFMREARLRAAAEWARPDLERVLALIDEGVLSLDGLITHRFSARDADAAYRVAFGDPECLKMILDWGCMQ